MNLLAPFPVDISSATLHITFSVIACLFCNTESHYNDSRILSFGAGNDISQWAETTYEYVDTNFC